METQLLPPVNSPVDIYERCIWVVFGSKNNREKVHASPFNNRINRFKNLNND